MAHLTVLGGNPETLQVLHKAGSHLDEPLDTTGFTPLHLACLRGREEMVMGRLMGGEERER